MEKNLKSIEVQVNIGSDTANVSRMQLVFDAERPTEMFNGLAQATKDLEKALQQAGILTEYGVGAGEMVNYVSYVKEMAEEAEQGIFQLYHVLTEVQHSGLMYKFVLEDMIQAKINEAQETVDKYYSMVDEVQVVEADVEFEATRPQTIVESVKDEATE